MVILHHKIQSGGTYLNEGFVIEAFQIDIEKGSEIEDTVDPLKKNEALYTVFSRC
ncbi:hypothetical protein [Vagococcus xieshaowenii]|uniref:hypothetical protein n=1 Tax=Vagococcus xieshaowenii TaxID=2562451 RepID=UPI001AEFC3D4|nr:hypothetical protein [Vagococcus xieshaowenii]